MPESVQHEISAHIKIVDLISGPMNKINVAVSQVSKTIDKLSAGFSHVMGIGSVALGALSFKGIIESANEHMRTIQRISTITGLAANRADAMVEAFEEVGMEGYEAERILMTMSRTGAKMQDNAMSAAMGIASIGKQMKSLGVDVTQGPEKAMVSLSEAVKKGKLDFAHLTQIMNLRPQQAVDFMRLLKKGPEHIRKVIEEAAKAGVTEQDLAAYGRMRAAQKEIESGWNRMKIIIGKEIYPIIATLLEDMKNKIPEWIEGAKSFGKFLKENLETAISLAKTLGKVLMANAMIQRVTAMGGGEGFGAGGVASRIGRFGWGQGFKGATLSGQAMIRSATGVPIGPLTAGASSMASVVGVFSRIISIVGRFAALGAIIALVAGAVKGLAQNFMGIRGFLTETFERMQATFAVFGRLFQEGSPVGNFLSKMEMIFKTAIPLALSTIIDAIQNIIRMTTIIARFINEIVSSSDALMSPLATWERVSASVDREIKAEMLFSKHQQRVRSAIDEIRQQQEAKQLGQRESAPYLDFRGSKFDITQKFAEGFDPDRIAVAFANDLAAIGERRLQSGFAPIFGVR